MDVVTYAMTNGIAKGDKGEKGEPGESGTQWYNGTTITGDSVDPTIFSDSGIDYAYEGDLYLNTETGNVYKCGTEGNATVATWFWIYTIGTENIIIDDEFDGELSDLINDSF